jgi:hypothetical protein
LGNLKYYFETPIPLPEFEKRLAKSPVSHQTNHRPELPFVRIWFENLRMIAKVNRKGRVICLKPLDAHTELHFQLAEGIAMLFGTKVEVEDLSEWGSGLPWLKAFREEANKPDKSERYGFRPLAPDDRPHMEDENEQDVRDEF